MKDIHYAYCVARIRAVEKSLLSKQDISSLINQKDFMSALNYLVQLGFAKENEGAEDIIKRQGEELNSLLIESVPDKKETDILYILNDYFNIKVIVKCALEGNNFNDYMLYPTTVITSETVKNVPVDDFSFLNEAYRAVAEKAYNIALKSRNGKFSDMIVDRAAIDALSAVFRKKNSGLLGEICAFLGDTANIKIALRCASTNQDADYIKEAIGNCNNLDRSKLIDTTVSGSEALISYLLTTRYKTGVETYINKPSGFEKWCDDEVIRITESAKYTSFGSAPVVSYFYRKNLEIKTVRMILTALKSGIDRSAIKERVRKLYA